MAYRTAPEGRSWARSADRQVARRAARASALFGFRRALLRRVPLRHVVLALCALVGASLVGAGCAIDPLETERTAANESQRFNRVELLRVDPDGGEGRLTPAALEAAVVELIGNAARTVDVAFEDFESEAVASALLEAHRRGVRVRVIGDEDKRSQAGFRLLQDSLPDGPSMVFGDGPSLYIPVPGVEIPRPGSHNRMTHNVILVDQTTIVNLSAGFPANRFDLHQLGYLAFSFDLGIDWNAELQQLHGGVFAITTSAFNGPVKSITDSRVTYPGTIEDFEHYFGPQERTLKHLIDEVFRARASVWVAAEALTNEFLLGALTYKARAGFDVRVVLDRDGAGETGSVYLPLLEAIVELNSGEAWPVALRAPDLRMNLVIIDAVPSPINGVQYETRAYVASQPFFSSIPWQREGTSGTSRPADAFMDSNLWAVRAVPERYEPALEVLITTFAELLEGGTP